MGTKKDLAKRIEKLSMYILHSIVQNGKRRVIEEPCPELKLIQKQLVREISQSIGRFPDHVSGVKDTSVLTNSNPHMCKTIIWKLDLKSFFQTVTVEKIFRSLLLNFLLQIEEHCMYLGRLPTGAPTSPILANISFLSTDQKILEVIAGKEISFTRYMDDLTFSSNSLNQLSPVVCSEIIKIISSDGWTINKAKSGIKFQYEQQKVTGVIVNKKLNVQKTTKLLLRSKLDHVAREGQEIDAVLAGELAFVQQINHQAWQKLMDDYQRRKNYYGGSRTDI